MDSLEQYVSRPINFVIVDDGSTDNTLEQIKYYASKNPNINWVSFSRNFGKEAALYAGLKQSYELGFDYIAVMDVDLQDPPSLLPEMLKRIQSENCDVCAAYRETRTGESPIRSWFARRFYSLINKISQVEMRDGARDFRVMRREVVQSIIKMPERTRFSKGIFMWVGFKTSWLGYENIERSEGSTSWSFLSLVRYALDGIIAFSSVPLEIISVIGLAIVVLALIALIFVVVRALIFGDPVAGWPSLVCSIVFFSGIQLLSSGVIGLYLAKVFDEIKKRPLYIVREQHLSITDDANVPTER